MILLFMGPKNSAIRTYLESHEGGPVEWTDEPLPNDFGENNRPHFLISHGYRHIVRPTILKRFPRAVINLHISYLPWNRGADPNFWSYFDDSPKGVSIHLMDEGIDTGEIIAQKHVDVLPQDTLASSYEKLQAALAKLFSESWPKIRVGQFTTHPQIGTGSVHKLKDREAVADALKAGWDTLGSDVAAYGKAWRRKV